MITCFLLCNTDEENQNCIAHIKKYDIINSFNSISQIYNWKNSRLPVHIIRKYNPYIFIIVERHMGPSDIIEVPDYKAIMHNRVDTHHKAKRY